VAGQIKKLERTVEQLEARLLALETQIGVQP